MISKEPYIKPSDIRKDGLLKLSALKKRDGWFSENRKEKTK